MIIFSGLKIKIFFHVSMIMAYTIMFSLICYHAIMGGGNRAPKRVIGSLLSTLVRKNVKIGKARCIFQFLFLN